MVDIARLRRYAESVKDVRGAVCELSVNSMINLLDQLEAAQKDAARYKHPAKLKHAWAVLGDIYDLPSEDEGANDLGSSIDIAIASKS